MLRPQHYRRIPSLVCRQYRPCQSVHQEDLPLLKLQSRNLGNSAKRPLRMTQPGSTFLYQSFSITQTLRANQRQLSL